VLESIDWEIAPGACWALLGPSAAGKTTLLRLIAGLEAPSSGAVRLQRDDPAGAQKAGEGAARAPYGSRTVRIGMVFQNLALWPHVTARRHVELVLRDVPRRQRRAIAEQALAALRLPSCTWDRLPDQLSGGECQRLALARALAHQPELLLLDEPLAQVDAVLRPSLAQQIRELIAARRLTAIYVTHHWQEALELCSLVAVLDQGRLVRHGPANEVYWNPGSARAARLTGPVCEIPRSWLASGLVERAGPADGCCWVAEETGQESAAAGGAERAPILLARPQQLHALPCSGTTPSWQVSGCRPAAAGWVVDLQSPAGLWSINMPHWIEPGTAVRVQLVAAQGAV
jgi:ABC-type Fe3+/spermidine/putrescine transport system ATPase subunit